MAVRFLVVCMLLAAFSSMALAERIECCQGDDCCDCGSGCDHNAVFPCFTVNHRHTASYDIAAETAGTARVAVADVFRPPSG